MKIKYGKKQKVQARFYNGGKWNLKEFEGYVVEQTYAKVFIYKNEYNQWVVCEYSSGSKLVDADTRKGAMSKALDRVVEHAERNEKLTLQYIQDLVRSYVSSHGIANGTRKEYEDYLNKK